VWCISVIPQLQRQGDHEFQASLGYTTRPVFKKKKVVYPYNGILFSYEKKNEALTHATRWMNFKKLC
jgi:hypothetical protein